MASGDGARTCGDGAAGARIACDGAAGGRAEGAAGDIPDIAVVLGSGLGGFAGRLADAATIPYADIPRFARSTAPGHKGNLIVGKIAGGPRVICMQGRFHMYEGYAAPEATRHVRVLRELGVSRLILTNASGGLNPAWSAGDLMLIEDHINFTGQNPLTGPNFSEYGPRFPDMSFAYDPGLRETVRRAAGSLSIPLREGVYVGFLGPSFETPAEIRMFQALGASAVGMSTVPEAIVANHCGMKVCGISCVTNLAAGILAQPLTSEEVLESAAKAGPLFEALLEETLRLLR
jgi:purine-nucleoside phosphorylase